MEFSAEQSAAEQLCKLVYGAQWDDYSPDYRVEEVNRVVAGRGIQIAAARVVPLQMQLNAAVELLRDIATWNLPKSGHYWGDGDEMSYEAAFGTNGSRDYFKKRALDFLSAFPEAASKLPSAPSPAETPDCCGGIGPCKYCTPNATEGAAEFGYRGRCNVCNKTWGNELVSRCPDCISERVDISCEPIVAAPIAPAAAETRGNETKPVADLLNSMKVIDRSQRYMECRADLLTQYMYELVRLRAEPSAEGDGWIAVTERTTP